MNNNLGQLFNSTQSPVRFGFLAKVPNADASRTEFCAK